MFQDLLSLDFGVRFNHLTNFFILVDKGVESSVFVIQYEHWIGYMRQLKEILFESINVDGLKATVRDGHLLPDRAVETDGAKTKMMVAVEARDRYVRNKAAAGSSKDVEEVEELTRLVALELRKMKPTPPPRFLTPGGRGSWRDEWPGGHTFFKMK